MIPWLLTPLVWARALRCAWVRLHWVPGERLDRLRRVLAVQR